MKVFISSVRHGLEEERDCLPGLLLAIGHEPLRFEDFTAQSRPSREACLRGVKAADVYLLLLGQVYGDPLAETGLSPTHEEYNAARVRGIPCLTFRKQSVHLEPAQADFLREVEAYSTGVFWDSFSSAVDLQAKVVAALANLPTLDRSAGWVPLRTAVAVQWRHSWTAPRETYPFGSAAELELHAVPVEPIHLSARQLRDTSESMARQLRAHGLVPTSTAIEVGSDSTAAWALPARELTRGGWNEPRPEALLGVRLSASGQRSVWQQLPSDSMGSLLDPDDLPIRIASLLRLLGAISPLADTPWALGVGLHPSVTLSVGPIQSLGQRTRAQGLSVDGKPLYVDPDEAAGPGALDAGSQEIGAVLAKNLLNAFVRRR